MSMFNGKVAVVTGGSGGIGRGVALRLAAGRINQRDEVVCTADRAGLMLKRSVAEGSGAS